MTLKEFYQKYGKGYPLSVVKQAYEYTKHEHEPKTSLNTASILHAAKLENRQLHYEGYAVNFTKTAIAVCKVKTETLSGLKRLSIEDWKRRGCNIIAKMGENCAVVPVAEFQQEKSCLYGVYGHFNRYVAVVKLECKEASLENNQQKLFEILDVLAKNALAWYPEYCKRNKISTLCQQSDWIQFLLEQPARFMCREIKIADIVRELHTTTGWQLELKEVQIFGM